MVKIKLIVGLRNPGEKYDQTRHNIGAKVVDALNKEHGGTFRFEKKLDSEIAEIKAEDKKVILAKPLTFMNNSGKAVRKLIKNYKLKPENMIIIHDDLDIPFGKVKVSFNRSSAGHKGVQSVIDYLKTDKFYRVRIGTYNKQVEKIKKMKDKRKKVSEINKFVIENFTRAEKPKINKVVKDASKKTENLM